MNERPNMFAQNDTPISIHERVELPDEQLRALAPSVFAAQAMLGVRYAKVEVMRRGAAEERVLVASGRDLRQEELWRHVESAMRFSSRHYRTIVRRPSRSPPNGSQPPGHNSHSLRVGFAPARIRVFRNSSPRPGRGTLWPVVEATTRSSAAAEHAARATLSSVPFASVSLS